MIPFIIGLLVGAVAVVVISCCYVSGQESRKEEQRDIESMAEEADK